MLVVGTPPDGTHVPIGKVGRSSETKKSLLGHLGDQTQQGLRQFKTPWKNNIISHSFEDNGNDNNQPNTPQQQQCRPIKGSYGVELRSLLEEREFTKKRTSNHL